MKKLILIVSIFMLSTLSYASTDVVTVVKGTNLDFKVPTLNACIVIDSRIADAAITTGNRSIDIRPKEVGSTLLVLWSDGKRKSYKLKVIRPKYVRKDIRFKEQADPPFKIGVSTGYSGGNSTSKYDANKFSYTSTYYVLDGYGNTPIGFVNSQIAFKTRDDDTESVSEISSIKLSLKQGMTAYKFGDQTISYSDYVLPYQDIQGLSYQTKISKAKINMVYGVNRNGWWGSDIYRDQRVYQTFTGADLSIPFGRNLNLGINGVYAQQEDEDDVSVYSFYGDYKFNRWIRLLGEVAVNDEAKAGKAGMKFSNKTLNFDATYRKKSALFKGVNDYTYAGGEGIYTNTRYVMNKNFSVSGRYNDYIDKRYSSDFRNKDINTTSYLDIDNFSMSHTLWQRDRGEMDGSSLANGQSIQLSYLFDNVNTKVYCKYSPSSYDRNHSTSPNTSDYDQTSTVVGAQFKLWAAYLTFEQQNNSKEYKVGDDVNPSFFRTFFTLPYYRLNDSDYYLTLYARYQNSYDSDDELEQSYNYLRARLDWMQAQDQKAYAEYSITDIASKESLQMDKVVSEFKFGTTLFFGTPYKYTARNNEVKGFVFMDTNNNGEMDADEDGIADIKVFFGDKKFAITDENGQYAFKKLSDKLASVSLDLNSLPKGYRYTSAGKRSFKLGYADKVSIDFGLTADAVVMGLVFHDVNNDGKYNPNEPLIDGVNVKVKGQSQVKTDVNGSFRLDRISAGRHEFSIDIHTLPSNYVPVGAVSRELDIKPGEQIKIMIPLKVSSN